MQQICQKSSQQMAQRCSEFLKVHKVAERSVYINSGFCVITAKFGVRFTIGISSDVSYRCCINVIQRVFCVT